MRILLLLISFLFITQINVAQKMTPKTNYTAKWNSVNALIQKGLNASAEKEVLAIMKLAKAEANNEQFIKAMCQYRMTMEGRDEKSELNDILFFEDELKEARFPVRPLLHSMLGELYQNYYEEARWQILDRTALSSEAMDSLPSLKDIETWSADQFYATSLYHFNQSLADAVASKSIQLKEIDLLIEQGKNTRHLRPTLFDFLIHRAINYFANEEHELTKPTYAFEINDERAFAPAAEFIRTSFNTSDTLSSKYQVLELYKKLLSFHLNDQDAAALIDADLLRLNYVKEHSVSVEKNKWYYKSLEDVVKAHPNHPQRSMAIFYLAESFAQGERPMPGRKGQAGGVNDDAVDYIEAKKRCDQILELLPKSEGAYHTALLLQQIQARSLQVNTEKAVVPNKPSLALINFRNIRTIYCKIVKVSFEDYQQFNQDYHQNFSKLSDRTAIKSWTVDLPERNDYKNHSTEIKIDALPLGTYAFMLSENKDFMKEHVTALSFMHVSNLAYVSTDAYGYQTEGMYVMHRESGKPVEGAKVSTWMNQYDYTSRRNRLSEGSSFTSDKNGYVKLPGNERQNGYTIVVSKGADELFLDDHLYHYGQPREYRDIERTFFFTDRSIYRPGQTIYFKGIMLVSKGKEHKQHELLKQRNTKVRLLDVNSQQVAEIDLVTNEYGSFSGTFTAPEGLLTGNFQLHNESGSTSFSVEEYKRPNFEVAFDSIQTTFRLNDKIRLKGNAKAFAGNAIDGASVKYRVVREARFPFYWCFYRWGQPASPSMEIAHGTSTTQADGSFDVEFKAIPDEQVSKESMPVFDYRIVADVTDLNGETRTGDYTISVAYHSLMLAIDLREVIDVDQFKSIPLTATNISGVKVPTDVKISVRKLKSPQQSYRSRLWPKAEIISIPEAQFRNDFPLDEYNQDNDKMQWPELNEKVNKQLNTGTGKSELPLSQSWQEGWYVIEASATDKDGVTVLEKKYVRLSSFKKPVALPNEHLLMTPVKLSAEPGQVASLALSTPYPSVAMLYSVSKQEGQPVWMTINNSKQFDYPITESDRGGFYINAMYILNNRWYHTTQFIQVPWTNKELKISLQTFRDRMLPGSGQEWRLKISGNKKEKVSAELLATMYDASLDAFRKHSFDPMNLYTNKQPSFAWNSRNNFTIEHGRQVYYYPQRSIQPYEKDYDELNWWGLSGMNLYNDNIRYKGALMSKSVRSREMGINEDMAMAPQAAMANDAQEEKVVSGTKDEDLLQPQSANEAKEDAPPATGIRSDFRETAFFFPHLMTDADGDIEIRFTAPEALTRWKLLAHAHASDLSSGLLSAISTTSKKLMIVPNTPRFVREGDRMMYSAKVINLSDTDIRGEAVLQLEDAITAEAVDTQFANKKMNVPFAVKAGESVGVSWPIDIPLGFTNPLLVRTIAKAKAVSADVEAESDGEQHVLPVLLNSMLVTETLPLPVRHNSEKKFSFANLKNASASKTLRHHQLSLEYTANPAWYAVLALPYLTDYPHDCSEQTFNRYYANAISAHIAQSSPELQKIYSEWKEKDTAALLSNLEKNTELKSALLQETPWVMEARNQTEQKRRIAELFDTKRLNKELARTIRELEILQTPNGGFSWFKGMPDDRFITQYIVTGIGRLMHLKVEQVSEPHMMTIVEKALPYLDHRVKEDYEWLLKNKVDLKQYRPGAMHIHYLYMRSFYPYSQVTEGCEAAAAYFKKQAATYWLDNNKYLQGMLALALHRTDGTAIAQNIMRSLRENAIHNEEMGMYWKEVGSSYWWHEAPIETQSLLIEAFTEVPPFNPDEVDELKIWLLKNKQTQQWKTTKATADACYALLLNGTYWLSAQPEVEIKMGNETVNSRQQKQEAGTGYFKTTYPGEQLNDSWGDISVKVSSSPGSKGAGTNSTSWGAVYWQYFENLDQIKAAATPLSLSKQLFVQENTDKGPVLFPITAQRPIKVGDKVKVRIELRVDRSMEYVHMKDMRAACFEPVNVLSTYKYQGGLGYYEATKDAAVNFFFHRLEKGTYVFEYTLFASNKGDYSNGIASIQCMYAPEFSSHSEGVRVKVE